MTLLPFMGDGRSDIISPCGCYRYELRNVWEPRCPLMGVCGLNPSTATAERDDQTTKKWTGFATRLGYGGWVAVNEFGWRERDPKKMVRASVRDGADIVGPENDSHICRVAREVDVFVVCWGAGGDLLRRDQAVLRMLSDAGVTPLCWGRTAKGQPKHPLMLPYDTPLVAWDAA